MRNLLVQLLLFLFQGLFVFVELFILLTFVNSMLLILLPFILFFLQLFRKIYTDLIFWNILVRNFALSLIAHVLMIFKSILHQTSQRFILW